MENGFLAGILYHFHQTGTNKNTMLPVVVLGNAFFPLGGGTDVVGNHPAGIYGGIMYVGD
ncbi:hypothetical protein AFK69_06965 [Xenorhabdus sp. GDc328]|nr:hypothetical protein AFK69_06965 [Xenorhabdus sp. GDc328]